MAIFKCKMCGGELRISNGEKVCECEYCGSKQTIPSTDNEKKVNLFNRANMFRFRNEFDKAEATYENIVSEFPNEAEAYWGLCLCKYGIEYVDDPKNGLKIPTCHRTSFESIFDDSNYNLALKNADAIAKDIYCNEAANIDKLQKNILSVVNREEPYDVFICYKESDENGERTIDSVIAQDIYDKLIEKGLRVFFSRITLENKLGTAYEPYIFAALNSAKVMLVIGTKQENYNAVWVKNEWSRFLGFMKKDNQRTLIPCYKNMDPYELPEDFRNLQGQDMGKIGAVQDIVHGVEKIIPLKNRRTVAQNTSSSPVNNLLERAFMFIDDRNWERADEYFEKVLDTDPKNGEAYLGKLMVEYKISSFERISKEDRKRLIMSNSFANNQNLLRVIQFMNGKFCSVLKEIQTESIQYANDDNERKNILMNVYRSSKSNIIDKSTEKLAQAAIKYDNGIKNLPDGNINPPLSTGGLFVIIAIIILLISVVAISALGGWDSDNAGMVITGILILCAGFGYGIARIISSVSSVNYAAKVSATEKKINNERTALEKELNVETERIKNEITIESEKQICLWCGSILGSNERQCQKCGSSSLIAIVNALNLSEDEFMQKISENDILPPNHDYMKNS